MKSIIIAVIAIFISINSFAAQGIAITNPSKANPSTLGLTIYGDAAQDISKHLADAGTGFNRDPISEKMIQTGKQIKCIESSSGLYCVIGITAQRAESRSMAFSTEGCIRYCNPHDGCGCF